MTLAESFARVLREKPEKISDATSRKTHRRWDSLSHAQIAVMLEETYHVKFTPLEIDEITSVAAARALLTSKGIVVT